MTFKNRNDAGILLAEKLDQYIKENTVLLAIPRGGVPVAFEIAKKYLLPLEPIMLKKIGHPLNKEYAIGAASLTHHFIKNHEEINAGYVNEELKKIRSKMISTYSKFMGSRQPMDLKNKTVIIIDDGMATGNTMLATIQIVEKSNPEKIIVATPVASMSALKLLRASADDVICYYVPSEFHGVGAFYKDFDQVEDDEVIQYLSHASKLREQGNSENKT